MNLFAGKTALVTGAGGGIGRAMAQQFAARGASVVVADLNEKGGQETVAMIEGDGGKATFVQVNVADESSVQAMVKKAADAFRRIDFLINNAGISSRIAATPLHDVPLEAFRQVMEVNVTGTFLCMKYAIPLMLETGGGAVVNLSSINGERGSAGDPSYPTSKHAVRGLTKSAALTYADKGVRVNAIAPGVVKTEMTAPIFEDEQTTQWLMGVTPMKRFAEPEEIAKLAVFLCSDDASFITGAYYPIDGGWLAG